MMLRSLGPALLALALTVACSSDDEEPVKFPDVASFCQAKATEECQVSTKCGTGAPACTAARKSQCETQSSSLQTATRTYRAKAAETCVNKAKEVYAKQTVAPADVKQLDEVCAKVFQGSRKAGEACAAGDCEGDLLCDKGVCASRVEKREGEFCGNPGETCAAGAFCTQTPAGSLQCAAKKKQGESCDASNPCVENLRCNNTCSDRFAAGVLCDPSGDDCGGDAPYCDPILGNKCGPGFIAAPGAPACAACPSNGNPGLCGFGG